MFSDNAHSPDGLSDVAAVDVLLAEIDGELAKGPQPTAAYLDGSALERRRRREAQRMLGATVRVLRVHSPLSVPTGTEAA
jgi:hypothetical protein